MPLTVTLNLGLGMLLSYMEGNMKLVSELLIGAFYSGMTNTMNPSAYCVFSLAEVFTSLR